MQNCSVIRPPVMLGCEKKVWIYLVLAAFILPMLRPNLPEGTRLKKKLRQFFRSPLQLSVFGVDDRKETDISSGPYLPIGRIEIRGSDEDPQTGSRRVPICTGSLVWVDLVLTNAHCVLNLGENRSVWFRPGFNQQRNGVIAKVVSHWVGTSQPSRYRGKDWALLKLDQPIGESVGWLPIKVLKENKIREFGPLNFVAYASDFRSGGTPFLQVGCRLRAFDKRHAFLRHDCDMNSGSSGAPLLTVLAPNRFAIVAINAAHTSPQPNSYEDEYSGERANVAVGATTFLPFFEKLIAERVASTAG